MWLAIFTIENIYILAGLFPNLLFPLKFLKVCLFIYSSDWGLCNFPGGSAGKASACNARDPDLIPGLESFPGEGNGNPLQYSCLENSMDIGTWWCIVHGITRSWTQLMDRVDREAWRTAIHEVSRSRTRLSDWSDLIWSEWLTITVSSGLSCGMRDLCCCVGYPFSCNIQDL